MGLHDIEFIRQISSRCEQVNTKKCERCKSKVKKTVVILLIYVRVCNKIVHVEDNRSLH